VGQGNNALQGTGIAGCLRYETRFGEKNVCERYTATMNTEHVTSIALLVVFLVSFVLATSNTSKASVQYRKMTDKPESYDMNKHNQQKNLRNFFWVMVITSGGALGYKIR
jgi:hypothetical protein